ncbi:MAG TPA: acyltransferase [Candidatus Thermoplasmatota archaeon]|nr:acyltransferase [Candidatus Thermoplasmatota archaeon]
MSRKDRLTERPSDGPRASLWYWPRHAGFLRTSGRYVVIVLCRVLPSFRLKNWMYRTLLRAKVHPHAAVGLEVTFDIFYPHLISIGEDAVVGYNTTILCHEYMADKYRVGPVVIERRATIGANTTLLPGVVVGEGATVSAMSLVNRDIPPGELWGGVPVRRLRGADGEAAAMETGA